MHMREQCIYQAFVVYLGMRLSLFVHKTAFMMLGRRKPQIATVSAYDTIVWICKAECSSVFTTVTGISLHYM